VNSKSRADFSELMNDIHLNKNSASPEWIIEKCEEKLKE